MIVLSLFDGMSCGQIALERAGFKVDKYYASEIDKYSQIVSKANYPNTIYLGDVRFVDINKLDKIDLLIGGSPCQSFSFAGKRKGMATKCSVEILTLKHYLKLKSEDFEFEGESYLFWEYMRILEEIKIRNPNIKFLLENVEMGAKWQKILTQAIGINPIQINSALVSAQNRERLYWTNVSIEIFGLFGDTMCAIKQPKDRGLILRDILQDGFSPIHYVGNNVEYAEQIMVDDKYYLSDKMTDWLQSHSDKNKEKGHGFNYSPTDGEKKGKCINSRVHKMGVDDNYITECREVRQLNPSKESGGTQPYQQNRVYDPNGLFPALNAELGGRNNIVVDEVVSGTRRTHNDGKGFREVKSGKGGAVPARAREDGSGQNIVKHKGRIRRLTPIECERLQTVPDNYTNYVSDTQRYKMIGNGWTIEAIVWILSHMN